MSEVQSRPSATRGRSSHRAGRSGLPSRGGRTGARHTNGDAKDATPTLSLDEQGEIGQLKKQYSSQLVTLRELFPDWTDDDLVFACQETNGDVPTTVERITDGTVSRFADVKKKDRTRSKVKEGAVSANETSAASTRGRSRAGAEGTRSGRGRTSERGRGGGRGGRGASSATLRATKQREPETTAWPEADAPASTSWDETSNPTPDVTNEVAPGSSWATSAPAPEAAKSNLIPEGGQKKSWAMIAKPLKPAPAAPKPTRVAPEIIESIDSVPPDLGEKPQPELDGVVGPPGIFVDSGLQIQDSGQLDPLIQITSSGDQLTEENLEQVPDISGPTPTETLASTRDPRSTVGTPYTQPSGSHQPPISRPPMSGFAANAWKAAGMTGRAASNPRRIMEQQETVVMPMNHAVDRAAVQFGSMGLNGDEGIGLEPDEDREEPETRAQPPQQSPAQPRASLPPVSHQAPAPAEASMPISIGTPKQAPGLPSQMTSVPQGLSQPNPLGSQPYGQYNRFGAGSLGQEPALASQKQSDPFNQPGQHPHQPEPASGFPSHSQAASEPQQTQTHLSGLSTGSNDFPAQYGGDQQRSAYQSYYGSSYGQQGGTGQQDAASTIQKASGGLGTTPSDSTYSSNQAQQAARFGDNQASGHTTPNPTTGTQQSMGAPQPQQGQHMPQHGQSGHGGGYGYGQPYYGNSYYNQYMGQGYPNQYSQYQQSYGGHYGAKNNPYGQPHHGYGSYDHASSPANASGFGGPSVPGRDNAFSSGLNDYGRSGSAQPSQNQPQAASGAGFNNNMPDSLGRPSSGFANQNQQYGQSGLGGSEDSLRPSQDARISGPSPSYGQPGRPGSAANSAGNTSSQSGYPPSQSQPHSYGAYPNQVNPLHSNTGSQFGSLGGLGGHQTGAQSHQGGSYGSYGGGFGNNYGGNYGRGGWGGNYGH